MAELVFLSARDVRELVDLDALRGAVADAFRRFSDGRSSVPPRIFAVAPDGILGAMPVHLADVATAAKLVTVFPGNAERGGESHQALIVVFDSTTGTPVAVMDGTHITAVRTAAATAVGVEVLARPDARVLAVLGAGVQGRSHLDAVTRVRDFGEIRVASRTRAHAEALASEHPSARAVASFEEAVRGADVVCCCTDAQEPVLRASWITARGVHVASVGGTFGPELDAATVRAGRVFVEWRGAVTNPPHAGAHDLQGLDPDAVTELGEVLSDRRPGRLSADEMTVYKSTGHAVEDAAAARLVLDRADATGVGIRLTL
jgi:ornithine cyclodeaminase/alanine dehydrogenase-like protein (mu-crystallin family)